MYYNRFLFSLFSDALKFSVIFTEIQVLDKFRYEDQFDHLGKYTADCSTNNCCLAIYKLVLLYAICKLMLHMYAIATVFNGCFSLHFLGGAPEVGGI